MSIRAPSEEYRFYQDRLQQSASNPRWTIRGDPDYPGHYTIEGTNIVDAYNKSVHWRSDDELNRMGQINEAYHKNEDRRLRSLIEDTKIRFQANVAEKVSKMWKGVFEAYEKGL